MNTLTLADLEGETASSGNSLLSMTMQMSMSLGVAVGAAVLSALGHAGPHGLDVALGKALVSAFHQTYLCMGVLGSFAALIFLQLSREEPIPESRDPLSVSEPSARFWAGRCFELNRRSHRELRIARGELLPQRDQTGRLAPHRTPTLCPHG